MAVPRDGKLRLAGPRDGKETNLVIEEKFPEVGVLLKAGREKGYILYEEIHTILSDEATAAPKDL